MIPLLLNVLLIDLCIGMAIYLVWLKKRLRLLEDRNRSLEAMGQAASEQLQQEQSECRRWTRDILVHLQRYQATILVQGKTIQQQQRKVQQLTNQLEAARLLHPN